ncbi:hypothetical protein SVXHx_2542 [Haloferax volcanii]|nr:hypothetical protein SVXHx_2542 [Haloferax lucentense]
MQHYTRRNTLHACGIVALSSLAWCSALPTDASDAERPAYERLDVTPVYVADGLDLSIPAGIETVSESHSRPARSPR